MFFIIWTKKTALNVRTILFLRLPFRYVCLIVLLATKSWTIFFFSWSLAIFLFPRSLEKRLSMIFLPLSHFYLSILSSYPRTLIFFVDSSPDNKPSVCTEAQENSFLIDVFLISSITFSEITILSLIYFTTSYPCPLISSAHALIDLFSLIKPFRKSKIFFESMELKSDFSKGRMYF